MDKNVAFVKNMLFLDQMLEIFDNSDYRALSNISGTVIMIRSIFTPCSLGRFAVCYAMLR